MSTTSTEVLSSRDRKEIRGEIAIDLLNRYNFVTMLPPNREIYVYDNCRGSKTYGIWRRELAEKIIFQRIELVLGFNATRYDKNEVISHIKDRTYHRESNDALFWEKTPTNLICVANGVLDIETGKLMEHNPNYHFLAKIPVEYIPQGDSRLEGKNLIDRFLHDILPKEEDVKAQYEWVGYCLYRSHFIHKGSLLVGKGANGKSTWINVLTALLGAENVVNVSLQSLCWNRFSIANMQGKLANTYADLGAKALKETGIFKMLTGGDVVDAERKFVQGRVKFVNHAKLIFSCNQIPPVMSDDTIAFWRRWNITKFPRVFDEDTADKNILERLIHPLELSSLLNNALLGLKRLLKNQRFSNYKNVEETRTDYISKSDPIWAFAEECLIEESDRYEVKVTVYEVYKTFCKEHNLPISPSNVFSRNLRKYLTFRDCQKTIGGKKGVSCYCGIRLKSNDETDIQRPTPEKDPKIDTFGEESETRADPSAMGKKEESRVSKTSIDNTNLDSKKGEVIAIVIEESTRRQLIKDRLALSVPIFGDFLETLSFLCEKCNKPIRESQEIHKHGYGVYHESCRFLRSDKTFEWSKQEEERLLNKIYGNKLKEACEEFLQAKKTEEKEPSFSEWLNLVMRPIQKTISNEEKIEELFS